LREVFDPMVKRLRDKKIVPQRCWDLKIVKQGGGEVMIKIKTP